MPPNNSLMLDPAGARKRRVPGPRRCARMGGSLPEPPGSIARGRWAALSRLFRSGLHMKSLLTVEGSSPNRISSTNTSGYSA